MAEGSFTSPSTFVLDLESMEEDDQRPQQLPCSGTSGTLTDLPSSFSYQALSAPSIPSYFDTQTDILCSPQECQYGSNKRTGVDDDDEDDEDEEDEDDEDEETEEELQHVQQFLPTQHVSLGTQAQSSQSVMGMIEETILAVIKTLALSNTIALHGFGIGQATQSKGKRQRSSNDIIARSPQVSSSQRQLIVTNGVRAKKLAQFLTVMDIIHEALTANVMVSKRDIFYRDVKLFRNQIVVDKIIENISRSFNVPRSSLNVTAASKGLLFGPARLALKTGKIIDCSDGRNTDSEYCTDEQGILIPPVSQIARMECNVDYVLIVEKEASFRHLVSTGFNAVDPKGILITGKGYPDIATRHMVRYIVDIDPIIPVFALVDNDPHGLDIYRVYKWGSQAHSFDAPNLAVPTIRLLGLTVMDRTRFSIPRSAYRRFSGNDRRKAITMLIHCRDELQHYEEIAEHTAFMTEIQKMLHVDVKCELQALCSNHQFGMLDFIKDKLKQYATSFEAG